jgi:hypothetical protein
VRDIPETRTAAIRAPSDDGKSGELSLGEVDDNDAGGA